MSNFILTPAWKTTLPAISKIVLISLADQANDDGVCWPSIESLVKRTGLSESTVFRHLKVLEDDAHIHREPRLGQSTIYHVHPVILTPCHSDTMSERHSPLSHSDLPLGTVTPTPVTCDSQNHQEPSLSPNRTLSRGATATRLPEGWTPTEIDEDYLRTKRPELTLADVVENFRDYWIAQPGAKGRKQDWAATWRTWVRNEKTLNGSQSFNGQPREKNRHERLNEHTAKLTGTYREQRDLDQGFIDVEAERVD